MDKQMMIDSRERDQINDYSKYLMDKYKKYSDFKLLVDKLASTEYKHSGHCGAVQDAAKLANLIVHNKFFRDYFKVNKNIKN